MKTPHASSRLAVLLPDAKQLMLQVASPQKVMSAKGHRVPVSFELNNVDDSLNGFAMHDFGAPDTRQKQDLGQRVGLDTRVAPGQQIVEDAHLREEFAMLKG